MPRKHPGSISNIRIITDGHCPICPKYGFTKKRVEAVGKTGIRLRPK
jgi:hypothetical protein